MELLAQKHLNSNPALSVAFAYQAYSLRETPKKLPCYKMQQPIFVKDIYL